MNSYAWNKKWSEKLKSYMELHENVANENSLFVSSNNELLGVLSFKSNSYIFEYDSNTNTKLSGLESELNTSKTLFPIFENLLPESDRRFKLYNPLKDNLLDVLVKLKNTHGDFSFSNDREKLSNIKNTEVKFSEVKAEILSHNDYPNIITFEVDIDNNILNNKADIIVSSLSGYQNKLDVKIENEKIVFDEKGDYLLKPFSKSLSGYNDRTRKSNSFPYISINEHLNMSFFKNELGFDVPLTAIVKADEQFHYLVKRYDRYNSVKFAQFDFAQLMAVNSDDKYNSTSEELFLKINEVFADNQEEKLKALSFYFASSVIQNNDLHLKNISVIKDIDNKYYLSPLYDVISTGISGDKDNDLALSINSKFPNQKGKFNYESFFGLADILSIDRSTFQKEAENIFDIYISKMPLYIEKTKEILKYHDLEYKKSEYKNNSYVDDMEKSFIYRVKQLEKVGLVANTTNENSSLRKEVADKNTLLEEEREATAVKLKELTDLLSEKEKVAYRTDIEVKNTLEIISTIKNELAKEKELVSAKGKELKALEKENTILSTKLEMIKEKEEIK